MSNLNENVFICDVGEDKQLKLYQEAFQECCNLSKKVIDLNFNIIDYNFLSFFFKISKDELFKLWDEVIDLAKVIKNKQKFLPTNKGCFFYLIIFFIN